jgi:stage II sporulation protein AA (anti-sigma F factor antagonist)
MKQGCLVYVVPQELDHHVADEMREKLEYLITTYQMKRLVFDFRYTRFMDSSGIGLLMGRYREMKYKNGSVSAVHLNERMQRIFILSGLHKIIECEEGKEVQS